MSARIQAKHKISRKLGVNLFGKPNDSFNVKQYKPGQHGKARKGKISSYSMHLKEKQKLRAFYDMKECQFRNYFEKAYKTKDCIKTFLGMLERRLDIVVYRSKMAASIYAAKQMIKHKHIKVNGKIVNVSSYLLKADDEISIIDSMKQNVMVQYASTLQHQEVPAYYEVLSDRIKYLKTPSSEEVKYPFALNYNFIIEFYSRKI